MLGTPSDLTEVVREQQVQEVIIFPESLSWESFQETMRDTIAAIPGVEIKVSPGFYEILATDVTVAHKAFVPLFTLRGLRITGADAVIKTLLDYTVALALTIVFAPLTALIALVPGCGAMVRYSIGLRSWGCVDRLFAPSSSTRGSLPKCAAR